MRLILYAFIGSPTQVNSFGITVFPLRCCFCIVFKVRCRPLSRVSLDIIPPLRLFVNTFFDIFSNFFASFGKGEAFIQNVPEPFGIFRTIPAHRRVSFVRNASSPFAPSSNPLFFPAARRDFFIFMHGMHKRAQGQDKSGISCRRGAFSQRISACPRCIYSMYTRRWRP